MSSLFSWYRTSCAGEGLSSVHLKAEILQLVLLPHVCLYFTYVVSQYEYNRTFQAWLMLTVFIKTNVLINLNEWYKILLSSVLHSVCAPTEQINKR